MQRLTCAVAFREEATIETMNKARSLVQGTFSHWQKKRASRMGAAISYYAIFSVAPFFILLIALVRTIFDKQTTTKVVAKTLNVAVGTNLSSVIQTLINSAYKSHAGILTAIIGGILLIVAALTVLGELNNDLDELWDTTNNRPVRESTGKKVMAFLKERLMALSLILLFGLFFLFIVAFSVFISFFHYSLPGILQSSLAISLINIAGILLGGTLLFAVTYRLLPNTKLPWKELLWGALATSLLFLIGKFLITWYIGAFGATSAYGAAGSIVGLLLWVYYSSQVFFIGAAGTFVYSQKFGYLSRK
jgi:membrane protein